MAWDLDDRFQIKENEAILAFIQDKNPSAHSDITDLLIRSAADLPDVRWYCPDLWGYTYIVLHTQKNVIFGLAYGMSAIAYRLPVDRIDAALAAGGKTGPSPGEGWVVWEGVWSLNVKHWCKVAHDHVLVIK